MARERILVVDTDLDNLSRIYLALIHRNFKVEASNKPDEIKDRIKRFKPSLIILNGKEYEVVKQKLKIPAIVLNDTITLITLYDGDVFFEKPVQLEKLIKKVEEILF